MARRREREVRKKISGRRRESTGGNVANAFKRVSPRDSGSNSANNGN